MSKYYKADDVISFLNINCPKDMWEYQIADLPTIEASEDCISREFIKNGLRKVFNNYTDEYWGMVQLLETAPPVVPDRPNCSECEHYEDHHTSLACATCIEVIEEQVTSKLTELGNSMVETIKGGFNKQDSKLEVSEDAISREYVRLIESDEDAYHGDWNETYERGFADAINKVLNAPSVIPKSKEGEWILECDAEGEGDNLYRCPECGQRCGCQEYDLPNYCGHCGAKMTGAE